MDLAEYSDEELLESGREAVKREQWPRAKEFLSTYVDRHTARGEATPASGLASYALCLAHGRDLKRGLEFARQAQHAVERGLRAAPDNFLLLRMRKRLGVRQPPPLPFLDRRHALNVRLGRIMHKIKGTTPSLLPA